MAMLDWKKGASPGRVFWTSQKGMIEKSLTTGWWTLWVRGKDGFLRELGRRSKYARQVDCRLEVEKAFDGNLVLQ